MAVLDFATNKLVLHVLYDGIEGAGKTTHLRRLCDFFTPLRRGELNEFTDLDGQGALFEWLRLEGGTLAGHSVRCHLIAMPAGPHQAQRRRALLGEADVLVVVCPNDPARVEESSRLLDEIDRARREGGRDELPLVLNVNHCDREGALAGEEIAAGVTRGRLHALSTGQADVGGGVRETIVLAMRLGLERLREHVLRNGAASLQGNALSGEELRARLLALAPPAAPASATAPPPERSTTAAPPASTAPLALALSEASALELAPATTPPTQPTSHRPNSSSTLTLRPPASEVHRSTVPAPADAGAVADSAPPTPRAPSDVDAFFSRALTHVAAGASFSEEPAMHAVEGASFALPASDPLDPARPAVDSSAPARPAAESAAPARSTEAITTPPEPLAVAATNHADSVVDVVAERADFAVDVDVVEERDEPAVDVVERRDEHAVDVSAAWVDAAIEALGVSSVPGVAARAASSRPAVTATTRPPELADELWFEPVAEAIVPLPGAAAAAGAAFEAAGPTAPPFAAAVVPSREPGARPAAAPEDADVTFEFRELSDWPPPDFVEPSDDEDEGPEAPVVAREGAKTAPPAAAPAGLFASNASSDVDELWGPELAGILEQAEKALAGFSSAPDGAGEEAGFGEKPSAPAANGASGPAPRRASTPPFARRGPPRPSRGPVAMTTTLRPADVAAAVEPQAPPPFATPEAVLASRPPVVPAPSLAPRAEHPSASTPSPFGPTPALPELAARPAPAPPAEASPSPASWPAPGPRAPHARRSPANGRDTQRPTPRPAASVPAEASGAPSAADDASAAPGGRSLWSRLFGRRG